MKTDQDLLREAFAALLRGDTQLRDDLCKQIEVRMATRERDQQRRQAFVKTTQERGIIVTRKGTQK